MSPRKPSDGELTLREQVIRDLATRLPAVVAQRRGLAVADVEALARSFGWPATTSRLRGAATLINDGVSDYAADDLHPEGAPGLDAVVAEAETVGQPELRVIEESLPDVVAEVLADRSESDEDEQHLAAYAEAAAVLDGMEPPVLDVPPGTPEVTAEPAQRHRTTLRLPLGSLVDADGTQTVLGWAVAEVSLAIDAQGVPRVFSWIDRSFTPEGAEAIRALHAALPGVAS